MADLLAATVAFAVLVVVALAVLVLATVAPLYAALQLAESRGFSAARWTVLTGGLVLLGLAVAYVLHRHDAPLPLQLLPLLVGWAGPLLLRLLDPAQAGLGGRAGLHE